MATITSPRPQSPSSSIRVQSPSGSSCTPPTSASPSLDLNAPRAPSPAPAQRRNRAALRDYYNLKTKPPAGASPQLGRNVSVSSTTWTATATTVPEHSESLTTPLDTPGFDAEAYVQELSRSADLKTVLRTEAVLMSEIRNLDGERKALVYDNYSKLIAATRTIGGLVEGEEGGKGLGIGGMGDGRGGVGGGGGAAVLNEMGRLGERVEAVRRMAEGLGGERLASGEGGDRGRMRMEKSKRDTVKWVLGAPERLKGMFEDGKRGEAEKEWSTVSAMLDQWEGVKGVEETRRACQEAIHVDETATTGTD